MSDLDEFRARVRAEHAREVALHAETGSKLEAWVSGNRVHSDAVALAMDMFMIQAYKAHYSVLQLGELGHIEDAATIARRLLELAVQALYVGGDEQDHVRTERAQRFIAHLWDRLDEKAKVHMPPEVKKEWVGVAKDVGPLPPKRARWGPNFKQMFEYAGLEATYESDYSFLSAMSHGSAEELIYQYSKSEVAVRRTEAVGVLLVYASRYYLVVAEMWDRVFGVIDADWFARHAEAVNGWKPQPPKG